MRPREVVLCVSVWLLMVSPLQASDGVTEINQAGALAGGVTPSDQPGFPVTIDRTGSYQLTSNLLPPANTHAILVQADRVTINLNGFALIGPVTCEGLGADVSCSGTAQVAGVFAPGRSVTKVMNGTIRGFFWGLRLDDDCHVEEIIAFANAGEGILSDRRCVVKSTILTLNGLDGMDTDRGNTLVGNIFAGNFGLGLRLRSAGGVVTRNVAGQNGGDGLFCFRGCVMSHNASSFNEGNGIRGESGHVVHSNSMYENTTSQLNLGDRSGYTDNAISAPFSAAPLVIGTGVYLFPNLCNGSLLATSCGP